MTGVEDTTTEARLTPSPWGAFDEDDDGPRVTNLHIGFGKYSHADHRYWRCENCGAESTDERALGGDFGNCC